MCVCSQAVMEGYVPGAGDGATARALGGVGGALFGPLGRPATIRPLTAAYQASSGPNQVYTYVQRAVYQVIGRWVGICILSHVGLQVVSFSLETFANRVKATLLQQIFMNMVSATIHGTLKFKNRNLNYLRNFIISVKFVKVSLSILKWNLVVDTSELSGGCLTSSPS